MFNVNLGMCRNHATPCAFTVVIEGCPSAGLPAIDYRRSHGLPEAPCDTIELPGFSFVDEGFCRAHPDKLTDSANVETEYRAGEQARYRAYENEVKQLSSATLNGYNARVTLAPETIRAYLAEQTPETARALLLDWWDYSGRSKASAEAKVAAYHAEKQEASRKIAEAREILAAELKALAEERDYYKAEAETVGAENDALRAELTEAEEAV